MMPTQRRPAAPPCLPPVNDEATVPFSDLFTNGFDRATVDATAQLADRSIFVASNGRRYRIESIPDPVPVYGRVPAPPPAFAQPVYPQAPPPVPGLGFGRTAPPPTPQLYPPDGGPDWKRSPSNASSNAYSPGGYSVRPSAQAAGAVRGADPNVSAHDITATMTHLSINGFGATPLYGLSDGGVEAATTLSEIDRGHQSPVPGHSRPAASTSSPRPSYIQHPQQPPTPQASASPRIPYGHVATPPGYWTPVNYAAYTAQTNAHLQHARQMALTATGALPSILDGATTVVTPPHRASDPVSSSSYFLPIPDDKEVCDGQMMGNGSGYGYGYYPPLHASVSAPPSVGGRHPSYVTVGGGGADIDTLTPVVVVHPQAPPSMMSDGASTGRDNVLPGEDLLFDG